MHSVITSVGWKGAFRGVSNKAVKFIHPTAPEQPVTIQVPRELVAYISTHHATHHWRIDNGWIRQRKHWHARHHHSDQPLYYGVTSALWDHVFRTAHPRPPKVDRNFPETPAGASAGRRVISDAALFAPIQQPRGTP
jgi:sterol desaturase/sphingolipid hydroxylase (fatty acid hydroxylase superfamily)